jgi:ACS family hexuronate transporter-like MFS transporter
MTRYRWVICGLLFVAVIINYVDRQILGVLKPLGLSDQMGWTEKDYADIVFYFQAAYTVAYIVFGAFIDKVGAKLGYGIAFAIWQIAHIAHAGAKNTTQFIAARVLLGVGEAGNFPAGLKAVTEWFPKKERAFAVGLFNAGTNIGAVVTPLLAPAIMYAWGWQMAFIITGVVGLVWLPVWFLLYRKPAEHPKVNAAELAYIEQDPADDEKKVGWLNVATKKETWGFSLAKFLIDPVWWMLLFWAPSFFKGTYEMSGATYAIVLAVVYLISDVGSVAGGWMSSNLLKRGYSLNKARKITFLVFGIMALPYLAVAHITNVWVAMVVVGILAAAHQAFSANLLTMPSDVFPRKAVGSVIGIGGMLGGVGGMIMAKGVGEALSTTLGYPAVFAVCAFLYLAALVVIHIFSPRYEPAKV